MQDIRTLLHIQIESPYWDKAYEKALAEPQIPVWLTQDYIRTLHETYGLLPKTLHTVLAALPFVQKEPALCLLAKTLYHILATQKKFSQVFTTFELPTAPDGTDNTIGYDCVALFPVLAHLLPSWDILKARGIEDAVLTDSLFWADFLFDEACKQAGKPMFPESKFKAYSVAIYLNHLIIGRLRFEIHENSNRNARIYQNKNGDYCVLMDDTVLHRSGHILAQCLSESMRFLKIGSTDMKKETANHILSYMHENFSENLTNHSIGSYFGYHPNYISSLIKRLTGMPIHQYIIHIRLTSAANLLENTALSCDEIAQKCGFCDLAHFSKCFKNHFGVNPSKYRNI